MRNQIKSTLSLLLPDTSLFPYISHLFPLRQVLTVDTIPILNSRGNWVDIRFRNSSAARNPVKLCVMFYNALSDYLHQGGGEKKPASFLAIV